MSYTTQRLFPLTDGTINVHGLSVYENGLSYVIFLNKGIFLVTKSLGGIVVIK